MWQKMDNFQKVMIGVLILGGIGFVVMKVAELNDSSAKRIENDESAVSSIEELESVQERSAKVEEKDISKSILDAIKNEDKVNRQEEYESGKYGLTEFDFEIDTTSSKEVEPKEELEVKLVQIETQKTGTQSKRRVKKTNVIVSQPVAVKKQEVAPRRRRRENTMNTGSQSTNNQSSSSSEVNKYLKAQIHGEQTVRNDNNVLVRLMENYESPDGLKIPRNTFINMVAKFSGKRLILKANSITIRNERYPLTVDAYDRNDSREGMDISSSVNAEIKKKATSDLISDVGRDIGVPGTRNARSALKDVAENSVVTLGNGDKLLITIE